MAAPHGKLFAAIVLSGTAFGSGCYLSHELPSADAGRDMPLAMDAGRDLGTDAGRDLGTDAGGDAGCSPDAGPGCDDCGPRCGAEGCVCATSAGCACNSFCCFI